MRPQALPYREGMTVFDAILAVGGLGPFAAGNRAHIVRTENGQQKEIKIRLEALINNGDMKQNWYCSLAIPDRSGDTFLSHVAAY